MVLCVLTVVHLCRLFLRYGIIPLLLYPPSSIMWSLPFRSSCLPLMLLLLIFSNMSCHIPILSPYNPFSSLPCHIPIPSYLLTIPSLTFPVISPSHPISLLSLLIPPCHIPIPSFPSARHQEESDHCRHESTCQSPHSNPHRGRVTGHWWGHLRGFRTHYGQGSGDGVSWVQDPLRAVLNFGILVLIFRILFQSPPHLVV